MDTKVLGLVHPRTREIHAQEQKLSTSAFIIYEYTQYKTRQLGHPRSPSNIKREENMKWENIVFLKREQNMKWEKIICINCLFSNISKIHKKNQTTTNQYQKLYSTPPWHGARTCKVSRKYSNAFLSYSAKTKHDGRTDGGGGGFNISRPGPLAAQDKNWHWGWGFNNQNWVNFASLLSSLQYLSTCQIWKQSNKWHWQ